MDERAESRVSVGCASIDLCEQPLRAGKVADRKQRLDPGRAGQAGVVHVELLDVAEQRRGLLPARGGVVVGKPEYRERDP